MKKLFALTIIAAMLAVPSFALAASDEVVGDRIVIGEGQAKIVSAPDEGDYVGKDIVIGEGEMKIVSINDDAVVGDDIVIGDGEFKTISIDLDAVVGEDIEIGEGEAKIVSVEEEDGNDFPILPLGIGAGALALIAGGLIYKKKMSK